MSAGFHTQKIGRIIKNGKVFRLLKTYGLNGRALSPNEIGIIVELGKVSNKWVKPHDFGLLIDEGYLELTDQKNGYDLSMYGIIRTQKLEEELLRIEELDEL